MGLFDLLEDVVEIFTGSSESVKPTTTGTEGYKDIEKSINDQLKESGVKTPNYDNGNFHSNIFKNN